MLMLGIGLELLSERQWPWDSTATLATLRIYQSTNESMSGSGGFSSSLTQYQRPRLVGLKPCESTTESQFFKTCLLTLSETCGIQMLQTYSLLTLKAFREQNSTLLPITPSFARSYHKP